ncbi:MAG: hypothetical protein KAI24_21685 [Planctomycetes bacterium]|nr:hypothetical protein [Planctomycetota bacterium]
MEGRDDAAVRTALDLMTLLVDTSLYLGDGCSGVVRAGSEADFWSSSLLHRLSSRARAAFDRGLEVIERRMLRVDCLRDHVAGCARLVVADEYFWPFSARDHLAAWRFGFRPEAQYRNYLEAVVAAEAIWGPRQASAVARARALDRARAACPDFHGGRFLQYGGCFRDAELAERRVRESVEKIRQLRHMLRW